MLSRRTADKAVMTVYAEHGTREQPVPADRRRPPVLDDRAAAELAGYGTRIAEHFGTPQDIEWARSGGGFFILQSRPITALPEPAADIPDTWTVPYPQGLLLPGEHRRTAARPAHAAVRRPDRRLGVPVAAGPDGRAPSARTSIREDDVGLPTINGYAYYYYRTRGCGG